MAMGDAASDLAAALAKVLGTASPAIGVAANVFADPYWPEAACRVAQLHAIENKRAVPACPTTPAGRSGGVGLRKVMPAMRAYVYAERHPIVKPVAVAAAIGIPVLIGYLLGKGSR
jgi:hypothetical protein